MPGHKYSIHLLPVAEDDLLDIFSYIASDNPRAGEKIMERFEREFAALEIHPHLGSNPDDEELTRAGYRYLVVGNYLIFCTLESNTVVIHRIVHGARDYKSIL